MLCTAHYFEGINRCGDANQQYPKTGQTMPVEARGFACLWLPAGATERARSRWLYQGLHSPSNCSTLFNSSARPDSGAPASIHKASAAS